jgi:hypothetical protein
MNGNNEKEGSVNHEATQKCPHLMMTQRLSNIAVHVEVQNFSEYTNKPEESFMHLTLK